MRGELAMTSTAPLGAAPAQLDTPSLYDRLGGYDTVARMVDDLLGRLVADPHLGAYFKGMNANRKRRARQLFVDFLCATTGEPALYTGGDMKTEHRGLGITESEWDGFMFHARAMVESQVAHSERGEAADFLAGLRGDIVEG
jgi:hemoglobin